ncbi:MAG: KpsF/GutQ family sugar-phosphate isomerase [Clostridium sp.]|nr:KpsF/GutQ family sugar-phosphate isomerase [Clostridium sp.]
MMETDEKLNVARRVFDIEIAALQKTREALGEEFTVILDMITQCTGKVIITGMGKPGHIATKIAATLSSLGTPSFYLHPAEALHGDLGMITESDIVIAISYSGESEEVTRMLPALRLKGAKIIAISGNAESTLVKHSDIAQIFPEFQEACRLGLAPTSSTTAALVYGDALAVTASEEYGFTAADFGRSHPAGTLGKKLLLKVSDIMVAGENNAKVSSDESLKQAIIELSRKRLGMVNIVSDGRLTGVITDGDLRRVLEKGEDIYGMSVRDIMTPTPVTIYEDEMAIKALDIIRSKNISALPVLNREEEPIGTIHIQHIVNAGLI